MKNYIKIKFIYLDEIDNKEKIERMWGSEYGEYYKIENSPFYVGSYALGDIIDTKLINNELFVNDLIEASGNSTIQIIFYDKNVVQKTRDDLKSLGCTSELSNISTLISVNIPSNVNYKNKIKPYLENGVEKELWDYQEACLAQ